MMNVAEWILVIMLSVALFVFLVAGIVLVIKLIQLAKETERIIITGQGIAAKADDIVDNVKGMTSVGGIVKTFTNRVIEKQERRYAAEDAAQAAAEEAIVRQAVAEAKEASTKARSTKRAAAKAKTSTSGTSKSTKR